MAEIGYALSSEEHNPNDLVQYARRAEEMGFSFALISDHFHPWVDRQGHSPFVWSVIGGIAQATRRLRLGTGVTCPTIRIHPAIIAQAAATASTMMPGRFFLGLGTGENLNEHILGDRWPSHDVRLEMLEEAVEVIRLLWQGGVQSYWGFHYTVENARLYTLPEQLPPIMIAAGGPASAEVAGQLGDGLISTAPDKEIVKGFEAAGGAGKPHYGQLTVCWAEDEAQAKRTAYEIWPNAGLKGELSQELPMPAHFEQAAKMINEEAVAQDVICGPDPERHIEGIKKFIDAGYEHVYIHQVGPDQEGFFQFYKKEILPGFR
ncbi:MAG TPA: TIGR03557 family F420-dependent LLM class oxidoreductase [Anaerolineae bacterium]|nr:TIGR03557 family F420-dependent LLM class oxidoreductase [Anaerolineae bacterium]